MTRRTIDVQWKGLRKLERDLETFAKKAVPHAARQVLNDGAFELQKEWRGEVRKTLTTRNQFTERSIRVDKARGVDLRRMIAVTGSDAHYMDRTEAGGQVQGKGKHGKAIPTAVAAGQAMGSRPIRRLPTRKNKQFVLTRPGGKAKNIKARNAAAVRQAASKGGGVVSLQTRRGHGVYRVMGSKRKPKVRMLYDLSRRTVRTSPHPTLQPALKRVNAKMPMIMQKAMLAQLKRNKVFGY